MILDPDVCLYDAHSLDPNTHGYDAHIYMYDAFICVPRSLTMMHVCMMHISMILDLDPEACMYVWCIYFSVTDGRTDEPTNKAILGVGYMILIHACMMHL